MRSNERVNESDSDGFGAHAAQSQRCEPAGRNSIDLRSLTPKLVKRSRSILFQQMVDYRAKYTLPLPMSGG